MLVAVALAGIVGIVGLRACLRPGMKNPDPTHDVQSTNSVSPWWIFIAVYLAMTMMSNRNTGARHLLPIYPALCIVGGGGLAWLIQRRWKAAALFLVLANVGEAAWLHGREHAYLSPIAGGPTQGYRWFVDSTIDWGADLPRLAEWQDQIIVHESNAQFFIGQLAVLDLQANGVRGTLFVQCPGSLCRAPAPDSPHIFSATVLQAHLHFRQGRLRTKKPCGRRNHRPPRQVSASGWPPGRLGAYCHQRAPDGRIGEHLFLLSADRRGRAPGALRAASDPGSQLKNTSVNQPLVSILIPCHNAAPWLAQTLESALAQTWTHREIIVVDDGSTDDSAGIAHTYADRGVRLILQENRGAAAARNHALQQAQGEFIQFLDADDLLAPGKIEAQVRGLGAAARPHRRGTVGSASTTILRPAVFAPEPNWHDSAPVEWLALNFAGRGMMPPSAWLTPRSLIDQAGPWDERLTLNDDGEYFCRVLLASSGVSFCAHARSFYRSNLTGSLSQRRTDAAWRSAFLSHDLSARHLLERENSPRTRRACADLFQRLAFAAYPDCPGLVRECEAKVRSHGGSGQRPGGGRGFQFIARLLGWKLARRLQSMAQSKTKEAPLP